MNCPHCHLVIHDVHFYQNLASDEGFDYISDGIRCPACGRLILKVHKGEEKKGDGSRYPQGFCLGVDKIDFTISINPRGGARSPAPVEVPQDIAQDYLEASLVINESPKASAALSRRALQHILEDAGGVKKSELAKEIQEVLNRQDLPTPISESIDHIRNVGNFAAHPNKSTSTGIIIDVEPGEAEYNLDVIEMLFDYYYVQPSIRAKKKAALDKKLAAAGKPPMKK